MRVAAFLAAVLGKSGTQRDEMAVDAMKNGLTRKGEGHEGCILLVVPSPVAQQWLTELSRWGWFAVAKLFGGAQGGAYERALSDAAEGRAEVAICSYDFLSTHAMSMGTDDDGKERWYNNNEWGKIKWRLVVFDEVHSVKNSDSNRSQCAKVRCASFCLSLARSLFRAAAPASAVTAPAVGVLTRPPPPHSSCAPPARSA
jgi:hypothetical protein